MNILSLFDGISIAQQALKNIGVRVDNYYASEIDKYAIQITQKNFPKTIQLGDIKLLNANHINDTLILTVPNTLIAFKGVDLIIGGSPCQDLSIAKKNRKGLDGERSGLFWEYVRVLNEVNPKYFILENVNSMPKEAKQMITDTLWGIEPIMINASLVSAQNRKRLFWVGKLVGDKYEQVKIEQPEDKGILLKDILEDGIGVEVTNQGKTYNKELNKSLTLMARDYKGFGNQAMTASIRVGQIGKGGQGDRIYSTDGKSVNLSANGGGRGAKTGLYLIKGAASRTYPRYKIEDQERIKRIEIRDDDKANAMTSVQSDSMVAVKDLVRKLTAIECERLQSLPDNFTKWGVDITDEKYYCENCGDRAGSCQCDYDDEKGLRIISNTQRYKCLGNGFNCAVIEHILKTICQK